jgi:hypothetical protein
MKKTLTTQARQLYDLLENKQRWARHFMARDRHDNRVDPSDPAACKFCLVGGVAHVTGVKVIGAIDIYDAVAKSDLGSLLINVIEGTGRLGKGDAVLWRYNDEKTHQQVMEVIATAVVMAEGAGV